MATEYNSFALDTTTNIDQVSMEALFESTSFAKPTGIVDRLPRSFYEKTVLIADGYDDDWAKQHFLGNVTRSAIVNGNSASILGRFPESTFQTCVTSPPYWSLRDYHIAGQIGLENSVSEYIERLVDVFGQVRRVLRDDGTLWLNIGDSYTSGGRTWRAPDKKNPVRAMDLRPPTPNGLKPKDLIGVPWRLAMALQEDGWYLRADIIWNKPNCQPESVKDRPTRSHEYVFLFSKSERYTVALESGQFSSLLM